MVKRVSFSVRAEGGGQHNRPAAVPSEPVGHGARPLRHQDGADFQLVRFYLHTLGTGDVMDATLAAALRQSADERDRMHGDDGLVRRIKLYQRWAREAHPDGNKPLTPDGRISVPRDGCYRQPGLPATGALAQRGMWTIESLLEDWHWICRRLGLRPVPSAHLACPPTLRHRLAGMGL